MRHFFRQPYSLHYRFANAYYGIIAKLATSLLFKSLHLVLQFHRCCRSAQQGYYFVVIVAFNNLVVGSVFYHLHAVG